MIELRKKTVHIEDSKNHHSKNQAHTQSPGHAFRWSQNTAWCTCGRWTLWNCDQESGRTSHGYHLANRGSGRPRKGGQDGLKEAA